MRAHASHLPAGHVQSDSDVLPITDVFSSGQLVQVALPDSALYMPAAHSVHGPPWFPEKPLLHRQSVRLVLPATDREFAGHWWQLP